MKKAKTSNDPQAGCLAIIRLFGKIFIVIITKRVGEIISFTKLFRICSKSGDINFSNFWAYREHEQKGTNEYLDDLWAIGYMRLTDFIAYEAVLPIKEYCLIQDNEQKQLEAIVCFVLNSLEQRKTAAIQRFFVCKDKTKKDILQQRKTDAIKKWTTFHNVMQQAALIAEKEKE
jgi:hypothetical protein